MRLYKGYRKNTTAKIVVQKFNKKLNTLNKDN